VDISSLGFGEDSQLQNSAEVYHGDVGCARAHKSRPGGECGQAEGG
jgi:hypothetical protein